LSVANGETGVRKIQIFTVDRQIDREARES
jgi:hypothetical protein